MKTRILKTAIVLGAFALPIAAYSQVISGSIIGGVLGGPVGAVAGAMIGGLNIGLFSDYVATHTVPVYVYNGDVAPGTVLPAGVTYYQVPSQYVQPMYYAVVNNHTVLVDPVTRKIVQVVN